MFYDEKGIPTRRWEQPGFHLNRSASASSEQTRSFGNAHMSHEGQETWGGLRAWGQTLTATNEKEKERKAEGGREGEREGGGSAKKQKRAEREGGVGGSGEVSVSQKP